MGLPSVPGEKVATTGPRARELSRACSSGQIDLSWFLMQTGNLPAPGMEEEEEKEGGRGELKSSGLEMGRDGGCPFSVGLACWSWGWS